MTIQGINKPVFYAYQFLNRLGEIELQNNDPSSLICKDNNGGVQALVWDFTNTHPGDSVNNQVYYLRDLPPKSKPNVRLNIRNVPPGLYSIEAYKVGYRSNDSYTAYLSMGRPEQLSKQQVEQLKKVSDGSAYYKDVVRIGDSKNFLYEIPIRENDVVLVKLTRL